MSDEPAKFAMYAIIMIVVLAICIGIATGFNPLDMMTKIDTVFEPGELKITNQDQLATHTKIDCSGTAQVLSLDNLKFNYRGKSDEKSLAFIIVLNYGNLLFVGVNPETDLPEIHCDLKEGESSFTCHGQKLVFSLQGVGRVTGLQVFHFTTWRTTANTYVIQDAKANDQTLSGMLDSHGDAYISSFDVAVNVENKCNEAECAAVDNETACKDKNTEGCYWGGWPFLKSCQLCPVEGYTDCRKYDTDQCTQCPIPKASCEVGFGATMTLRECQPR